MIKLFLMISAFSVSFMAINSRMETGYWDLMDVFIVISVLFIYWIHDIVTDKSNQI